MQKAVCIAAVAVIGLSSSCQWSLAADSNGQGTNHARSKPGQSAKNGGRGTQGATQSPQRDSFEGTWELAAPVKGLEYFAVDLRPANSNQGATCKWVDSRGGRPRGCDITVFGDELKIDDTYGIFGWALTLKADFSSDRITGLYKKSYSDSEVAVEFVRRGSSAAKAAQQETAQRMQSAIDRLIGDWERTFFVENLDNPEDDCQRHKRYSVTRMTISRSSGDNVKIRRTLSTDNYITGRVRVKGRWESCSYDDGTTGFSLKLVEEGILNVKLLENGNIRLTGDLATVECEGDSVCRDPDVANTKEWDLTRDGKLGGDSDIPPFTKK